MFKFIAKVAISYVAVDVICRGIDYLYGEKKD